MLYKWGGQRGRERERERRGREKAKLLPWSPPRAVSANYSE